MYEFYVIWQDVDVRVADGSLERASTRELSNNFTYTTFNNKVSSLACT